MNKKLKTITIYIDEAWRGPLAGPVHVGLIVAHGKADLTPYKDSKKCSEKLRTVLFEKIKADSHLTFAVGISTAAYIDKHGLTKSLQSAIIKWIHSIQKQLHLTKEENKIKLIIDGNHDFGLRKKLNCEVETIIKWDDKVPAISAASIVAKVTRDVYMRLQHSKYSQYEFATHKWYGTKMHYEKLATYGPSPIHRKSFLHEVSKKLPRKKVK